MDGPIEEGFAWCSAEGWEKPQLESTQHGRFLRKKCLVIRGWCRATDELRKSRTWEGRIIDLSPPRWDIPAVCMAGRARLPLLPATSAKMSTVIPFADRPQGKTLCLFGSLSLRLSLLLSG